MEDPTDSGLAITGIMIIGLCGICCLSIVLREWLCCCKESKSNTHSLDNNGDRLLSEVTIE